MARLRLYPLLAITVFGFLGGGFVSSALGGTGSSGGAGAGSPQPVGVGLRSNVLGVIKITVDCPNLVPAQQVDNADMTHGFGEVTAMLSTTSGGNFDEAREDPDTTITGLASGTHMALYGLSCQVHTLVAGAGLSNFALEAKKTAGQARVLLFDGATFPAGTTGIIDVDGLSKKIPDANFSNLGLSDGAGQNILSNAIGFGTKTNPIDIVMGVATTDNPGNHQAAITFQLSAS